MVEKTTKTELEFTERELEMIDDYLEDKEIGIEIDDKTEYLPVEIKSIISQSPFLKQVFELCGESNLHCNEFDEKLHEQIKQYQDEIRQYEWYKDKLYNHIRQYQDHIDKCHKDITQYQIEFCNYSKEIINCRIESYVDMNTIKKGEDRINKLENEVKKLKEENSKLKKELDSPKVINHKKPVEIKEENSKLKKENKSPKVASNKKPIEMAVSAK